MNKARGVSRLKMNGVVLDGIVLRRNPQPAAQAIHQQSRRSFTLMRQAVSRPKASPIIKSDIKRQSSLNPKTKLGRLAKADPAKLVRAKQIGQHSKVSRFGQSLAPLPRAIVSPMNKLSAKVNSAARSSMGGRKLDDISAPNAQAMALARPLPNIVASPSHQRLEAMLDRALDQADAHKQMLKAQLNKSLWSRLKRPRNLALVGVAALIIALLLIGAYLKVPAVAVRAASFRAGISAQTPTYIPPGFSLSSTSFKQGDITLKFSKGSNNFTIDQQASGLNSESLRSTTIAPNSKLYQSSDYNGVTVYTYNDGSASSSPKPQSTPANTTNAALVNNGLETTVTNNAGLSTDQVNKIVQGLL